MALDAVWQLENVNPAPARAPSSVAAVLPRRELAAHQAEAVFNRAAWCVQASVQAPRQYNGK